MCVCSRTHGNSRYPCSINTRSILHMQLAPGRFRLAKRAHPAAHQLCRHSAALHAVLPQLAALTLGSGRPPRPRRPAPAAGQWPQTRRASCPAAKHNPGSVQVLSASCNVLNELCNQGWRAPAGSIAPHISGGVGPVAAGGSDGAVPYYHAAYRSLTFVQCMAGLRHGAERAVGNACCRLPPLAASRCRSPPTHLLQSGTHKLQVIIRPLRFAAHRAGAGEPRKRRASELQTGEAPGAAC